MDKNMIKIDDLVRQRLSGGEEEERAGAWLKMRDMLDNESPSRRVAFGWRKILAPTLGLLLLASLGMGGYRAYNQSKGTRSLSANGDMTVRQAANSSIAYNSIDNTAENLNKEVKDVGLSEQSVENVNTQNNSQKVIAATSLKGKNAQYDGNHIQTDVDATLTNGITKRGKNSTGNVANNTHSSPNTNQVNNYNSNSNSVNGSNTSSLGNANRQQVASNHTNTHNSATAKAASKTTALNNTLPGHSKPNVNGQAKYATNNTQSTSSQLPQEALGNGNNATNNNRQQPAPNKQSLASKTALNSSADNLSKVANAQSQPLLGETAERQGNIAGQDSIQSVFVVQRAKIDPISRRAFFFQDTSSIGKIAAPPLRTQSEASNQVALNSQSSTNQNNNGAANSNVQLNAATHRAKSKSNKSSWIDKENINEKVEDAKYKLSQIKFQPGITFGMNSYLYGPNSMMGIQAGVRGVTVFNEKWSMLTELKYMQRFNQSYSVKDNYWQIGTISGNQYEASEIDHYFKFSTLKTIELPLAVRYMYNKLVAFVGGNLVYNFSVNAEEITHAFESKTYQGNSFDLTTVPSVKINDFNARFSLGYLLGVGYQVSPAFEIDARMTKNFWDNAAGTGPRKVSQSLLYMPSVQISVNFRFNQRNTIPPAR